MSEVSQEDNRITTTYHYFLQISKTGEMHLIIIIQHSRTTNSHTNTKKKKKPKNYLFLMQGRRRSVVEDSRTAECNHNHPASHKVNVLLQKPRFPTR
jgi:hypothetical protein